MSGLRVEAMYVPAAPGEVRVKVRCLKCGALVPVLMVRGAEFNCECRDTERRRKTYRVESVLPFKVEEVKG